MGELKRSIETDQKEKTELVRQMHERDLAIKEASLIKDNLNVEISTLRQELQLSLEEGKRNRENDRITHLEENNRLNQRIDQLEGRNQQLQDKVTKSTQDYDSLKKKYSNKLKLINDDNLMLKAEKEKLKSELELTSKTKGVSREEYEKVKRKAEIMRKRMANFALAINAGVIPNTSLDSIDMTLSPQKMPSYSLSKTDSMSMVDLSQINRRELQRRVPQLYNFVQLCRSYAGNSSKNGTIPNYEELAHSLSNGTKLSDEDDMVVFKRAVLSTRN